VSFRAVSAGLGHAVVWLEVKGDVGGAVVGSGGCSWWQKSWTVVVVGLVCSSPTAIMRFE